MPYPVVMTPTTEMPTTTGLKGGSKTVCEKKKINQVRSVREDVSASPRPTPRQRASKSRIKSVRKNPTTLRHPHPQSPKIATPQSHYLNQAQPPPGQRANIGSLGLLEAGQPGPRNIFYTHVIVSRRRAGLGEIGPGILVLVHFGGCRRGHRSPAGDAGGAACCGGEHGLGVCFGGFR